jgi:DNA-binding IclR family transcriptional regulator
MVQLEIAEKIMAALSNEPVTFNKLCRASKLHPRTVRKYLELIQSIQSNGKIEIERDGFRLVIIKRNK